MRNMSDINKAAFNLKNLMALGKDYFEKKRYDLAAEKFKEIIAVAPNNGEAHFELGKTYYIQNDYQRALDELKQSERLCPQGINHHLLLAKIYKTMRKFDLALNEIKYALDNPLHSLEANNELNDIYPEFINEIKSYNFKGDYKKVQEKVQAVYSLIPQDDIFSRNKLLNELEIAQKKLILDSRMRNLIVTLSTRCNLNCTMCEEIRLRWEIPQKTLREVISFFPYLERIVWQGGEVFLLDFFGDLIKAAAKFPKLRQVITTNGLLIDERWAEDLVKSNVDLTFSIDGATKDIYESIRRGAKFETLIRNLSNFNQLRKQHHHPIDINLHVVVMKSNYHQLERFIDFAKEYDFKLLALLPIGGNYGSPENIFHFKNDRALKFIKETIPKIRKKAEEYGILLENRLPIIVDEHNSDVTNSSHRDEAPQRNNKMLCHLPWIQLYIDYDGTIRPDCVCEPREYIGNVLEDSLEEVWNNQKMQTYRKKIIDNCCDQICNPECVRGRVSERYLKFS